MAFLTAAVRWPDALTRGWHENPLVELVERYREQIPSSHLRALPAPVLLILPAATLILLTALIAASSRPSKVAVSARSGQKAKRTTGARTVLLLGPTESGKTSIFSALVYGTVPKTHTSQRESEGQTIVGTPPPAAGQPAGVSQSVPIHLIDLPGHPRLRVRAADFLPAADAIVYCVDATLAARAATAATSGTASEALSEAIDFFHSTLGALAAHRLKGSSNSRAPPSLQVLFTRADLSPLLGGAAGADEAQLSKRKAQLLQRARAGFESELARRRSALQTGKRSAAGAPRVTKIGGIGEVQGGAASGGSLLARLRALLGVQSSTAISEKDGDEEEEEEFDYVDWAVSQRQTQSASSFSLDSLDEEVIDGGKASWGLISLGKERDWLGGSGMMKEGKDDRDLRAFLASL